MDEEAVRQGEPIHADAVLMQVLVHENAAVRKPVLDGFKNRCHWSSCPGVAPGIFSCVAFVAVRVKVEG